MKYLLLLFVLVGCGKELPQALPISIPIATTPVETAAPITQTIITQTVTPTVSATPTATPTTSSTPTSTPTVTPTTTPTPTATPIAFSCVENTVNSVSCNFQNVDLTNTFLPFMQLDWQNAVNGHYCTTSEIYFSSVISVTTTDEINYCILGVTYCGGNVMDIRVCGTQVTELGILQ